MLCCMSTGGTNDATISHRRAVTDEHEPIRSHSRSAIEHGSSLYVNIPELWVQMAGVDPQDELVVESFDGCLLVRQKHE